MQKDRVHNMSKFTCIILCAMAVLNSVYAVPPEVEMMLMECAKEHGVTDSKLEAAVVARDTTTIEPCFWGCILKKAGFINDKGEYDPDTGLNFVTKNGHNERENELIKEIAKQCDSVKDKAVSDGEAGCERGALLAACVMEQIEAYSKKMHP